MQKKTWIVLLIVLCLFLFICSAPLLRYTLGIRTVWISSIAMSPALLRDDYIIIDLKYYRTNKPKKGDIISFMKFPEKAKTRFVQRVIAVEGDIIESRDKVIYINGEQITEPYAWHGISNRPEWMKPSKSKDNFGPYTISKGKIFVMGDNRENSYDSRNFGYVDSKEIEGKAMRIYWSKDIKRICRGIK